MLDVYLGAVHVGVLDETDQGGGLTFTYGERALDHPTRMRLSVRLPIRVEPYGYRDAGSFFDNLLPEGDARDLLARTLKRDASHTYALLGDVGGECAGAVSLWPRGEQPPSEPRYAACTAADLERLFDVTQGGVADDDRDMVIAQVEARASMSGTQDKVVVLKEGTRYSRAHAGAPTTALLKRERVRYPGLVQNELASLLLMASAGVPVARGAAIPGLPRVFESLRYDRVVTASGVERLHQEDFCQATGRLPKDKYGEPEKASSPTYNAFKTVLQRYAAMPLRDLDLIARWAIANVCVGNNDAHAKNLSILYDAGGIRLAPVYDVVCTAVYPQLRDEFALALGGAFTLGALTPTVLRKFGGSLSLTARAARATVDEVTTRIDAARDGVFENVARQYGDAPVLAAMRSEVERRTAAVRKNFLDAG